MLEAAHQKMTQANQSLSEVLVNETALQKKEKLYYRKWWLHLLQLRNIGCKWIELNSVDERIIFLCMNSAILFQTFSLSHLLEFEHYS